LVSGFIYRHLAGGPPTTGLYAFYDIGTELGKGSFATVMKAVNRETGVWYAVKMIKDKTAGRGGEQQGQIRNAAIAREINIMEKLKHPNICELKEVFLEENGPDISESFFRPMKSLLSSSKINPPHPDLVIELVEGGDLLEYILKRGGLGTYYSQLTKMT
jgi:serine/threonine/tyrosine protein kinase RAD53